MLWAIVWLIAAVPLPPAPEFYVTDRAAVFDKARWSALNEKLAQFERDTSDQVMVYIDQRIPEGTTLEEMSAEAIKTWRVGQQRKDNGVILFVFVADRKMRIEVGYGLEGALTDAKSKRIITEVMTPAFKAGDIPAGVEKGVDAIFKTIRGEPLQGTGKTVAETRGSEAKDSDALIGIAMLVAGILQLINGGRFAGRVRDSTRWPSTTGQRIAAFGPLIAAALVVAITALRSVENAFGYGCAAVVFLGAPFLIGFVASSIARSLGSVGRGVTYGSNGSSSSSDSSWSSSSSSSDSSSSSSFSGGGGSGGGGGASGSW